MQVLTGNGVFTASPNNPLSTQPGLRYVMIWPAGSAAAVLEMAVARARICGDVRSYSGKVEGLFMVTYSREYLHLEPFSERITGDAMYAWRNACGS